jgi:peptidoglycan/xylan/chitin deacetylase (PgdA/CDA1 family)
MHLSAKFTNLMGTRSTLHVLFIPLFFSTGVPSFAQGFVWPDGKRAALSLSFDDALPSQVVNGLPVLRKYKARVTFYVLPDAVRLNLDGWRQAVADGHEIGNHTIRHPCSGNFDWVLPENTTENYTLERIETELLEANTSYR